MADDIKGRTYQGTETYGQAFERMNKGQAGYAEAVRSLADEMARLNGLSDEQRQWLNDYIEGLDNVRDSWEKINDYVEDLTGDFDDLSDNLKDIRSAFTDIVKDLTSTRQNGTETVTLFRNLRDIAGDLERSLSVQNGASETNLNSIQKRAQKAREIYEYGIRQLTGDKLSREAMAEAAEKAQKRKDALEESLRIQKDLAGSAARRLGGNEAAARRAAEIGWYKLHGDEVRKLTGDLERLDWQNYQAVLGLDKQATAHKKFGQEIRQSSAGLGLLSKALEKMGLSGAREQYDAYVQANIAARQGKGPGMSKEEFLKNLLSPESIKGLAFTVAAAAAVKLWAALKAVSTEVANLQQNIGKFDVSLASANTKFASTVDWLKTANELASQFYINPVSLFNPDEIAALAEAKNLLGYSSEQAGNLAARAKMVGQTLESYEKSIDAGIHAGQAANKTAFAHNLIAKDVLNTTDATALSMGNNVTQISKAAVAARALGTDLQGVQKIAENLVNFESSIENEMKAQLLTGNQLNLARARGLALQNDLEGVAREIGRQGLTVAKFNEMNLIQQKAYAEALGMSRDELAKMVIQQDLSSKVTEEMRAKALGVTIEESRAMGISEQWHKAVDKLAQAFTPLLEAIVPIVEKLSKAVSLVAGFLGQKWVAWAVVGIGAVSVALRGLGIISTGLFKKLGTGIAGAIKRLFSFSKAATVAGSTTGRAGSAAGAGLKGLGAGLVSVIPSMLAFSVAAVAVGFALKLAAPGLEALGKLAKGLGESIGAIFEGIGKGIASIVDAVSGLTLENAAAVSLLGLAIFEFAYVTAASLPGLAIASISVALLGWQLGKLAKRAQPVKTLAEAMQVLASSIGLLKSNISGLDLDKLGGLSHIAIKAVDEIDTGKLRTARAAVARSRAVQSGDTAVTQANTARIESLLTAINNRLNEGYDVYLDADKVGRTLAVRTTQG